MKEPTSIQKWQETVHQLALDKGWFNEENHLEAVWKYLGNIHGEVSEAWEIARMGDFDPTKVWLNEKGKPEGFPTELADILIRVLDVAQVFGIDMQEAMWQKHQYNATRPYRHGGKRA